MRLSRLWLADFRCYKSIEIAPAPGLTAILGDNGQGKTSLLEAVGWLATGRSFRGVLDAALVRDGGERAIVRGEVVRSGHVRLIEAEIPRRGRNRVQVNRQPVSGAKALEESLRVTAFSPDDLGLVKGGPGGRRTYLDDLATAISAGAASALSEYERVVRQRTALLRGGVRGEDDRTTLAVWDEQLVRKGAEVVRARLGLLGRLEGPLGKAYGDVAGGSAGEGEIATAYEASWAEGPLEIGDDVEQRLEAGLGRERRREIDRGVTLVGPHRDEWRLEIGGLDSRTHASQGEQRSLALALRLAGHDVVRDALGEPPVLLLDDVFSELDPGRARALVAHLPDAQALVTTAASVPAGLPLDLQLRVAGGSARAS